MRSVVFNFVQLCTVATCPRKSSFFICIFLYRVWTNSLWCLCSAISCPILYSGKIFFKMLKSFYFCAVFCRVVINCHRYGMCCSEVFAVILWKFVKFLKCCMAFLFIITPVYCLAIATIPVQHCRVVYFTAFSASSYIRMVSRRFQNNFIQSHSFLANSLPLSPDAQGFINSVQLSAVFFQFVHHGRV